MRPTIVVDDDLMATALKLTGAASKAEVVESGVRALVRLKQQEAVRAFGIRCPGVRWVTERGMSQNKFRFRCIPQHSSSVGEC